MRPRGAAGIVAATLLALTAAPLLTGTLPRTHAEDVSQDPVSVSLTGLAPVALGDSTSLSVSGHVANTGLDDLTAVSVRLTLSSGPMPDRGALRQVTRGNPVPNAIPLYSTDTPIADILGPGMSGEFRITVRTADLPLGDPGVYVVGAEVVGYGTAGYVILGSAQALLPYVPPDTAPISVTWLWPLATWPGQTSQGVLLGDLVPREVSEGGRLRNLLDVGATSRGVSWVVDPQALQMVSDMADGYLVQKGGDIRPGSAQAAAAQWSQEAREVLGADRQPRDRTPAPPPPLLSLPYADIDADAAQHAELDTDIVRAVTSAPDLLRDQVGRAPDATVAWAAGGRVDPRTLDLLASSGVRAVVVREGAVPLASPLDYTPTGHTDLATGSGPVRALIIDSGLLDSLTMPQGNQSQILAARQRFLSELAFVALDGGPAGRSLVASAGSTRWDPNPRLLRALLASLRGTPWTRLVPVDTLLAQPATTDVRTVAPYDAKARGRELSHAYFTRVTGVQDSVDSLRSVVTNPLSLTNPIMAALLRAESSAWRTRPANGISLLAATQAAVDAEVAKVYVVPRDGVTFSGDRGSVPVTVANDFDESVRIGVTLLGSPAARLSSDAVAPVDIEPGKRASLEIPVRIVGSDALPVAVQLVDAQGRPFGAPVTMELRTTAYSRAALWVALAAAALLVLLVVFDIVRRARQRRTTTAVTPS
ncbi:MAG: DUF6049 family protein [Candidatus Nanopelagicales bacterium]